MSASSRASAPARFALSGLSLLLGLSLASCHDRAKSPGDRLTAVEFAPPALPEAPPPGAPKPPPEAPKAPKAPPAAPPAAPKKRAAGKGKEADRARPALGINLDQIADWSPDWAFVDAQKRARDFISATRDSWEDKRKLALDPNGWPTALLKGQIVRSLVFWGDLPIWPAGKYVVLYDGKGKLEYDPDGSLRESKPGRDVLSLDPKRGNFAYLITSAGKGTDYLRNVRVLMPGGVCEGKPTEYCDEKRPCSGAGKCLPFEKSYKTQIFHPKFLEKIQPFGAIRFMDWMVTNHNEERRWEDRPKLTDARWTHGVPVEIMVSLCNLLSQHAWFNIPHAADDEYVREFASYVRANLRPELKVYVEYSNEVWNGIFPQSDYATEQGKKQKLGESNWDAQWRFYAKRTIEIHKIWETVYQGQRERLVRVAAAQAANLGVAESILGYPGMKEHVDALAIAPYFGGEYGGPEETARWENASVSELIEDMKKRSIPNTGVWVREHAAVAKKYGVDLIAYEGGQSLAGIGESEKNEKLNKLFDAAQRDPRMKELYLAYLATWRDNGGQLFMHFSDTTTHSKYGRWGALESLDQSRADAPKYDALLTFLEQNPRWW